MVQSSGNEIILSLVRILKGHQVCKNAIIQALDLICNFFSFDGGLVYETDVKDHFCLMEHYELNRDCFQECATTEFLDPQIQYFFAQKSLVKIEKNSRNTSLEQQLLDMHNAELLLVVPVANDNWDIYGMVIFLNISHKDSFEEQDLEIMSDAFSLLVRYVGVRMYQKMLMQNQDTLESVLDNAGIDIYVNDFYNHDILYTNASMAAPYGGKKQFLGKKCWEALFSGQSGPCEFCPQKKLIDETGMPTKVYSWDYQRAFDRSWFRVFSAAFHWVDGRLAHVVSSADITENKRNEALIENLANYDQLTQLPNRRSLINECERRISKAADKIKGYLLFFDIDGFKLINDNFGHDAGDEFLILLGAFFSGIPMLNGAIYRNGGDEFVALIDGDVITIEHIKQLADFIHERFKKPWKLTNGEVFCNTSIGVACYPEDGVTPQELLQKADKAMYCVKKAGGGGLSFSE